MGQKYQLILITLMEQKIVLKNVNFDFKIWNFSYNEGFVKIKMIRFFADLIIVLRYFEIEK